MISAISAFLFAAGAVTLAEMGDKTQLLAMCFATRFNAKKVLLGVFIATIINHALAVAAGFFLKEVMVQYSDVIQVVASLSFVGFALWTIKGDEVDDSCDNRTRFGPVITVAIAFFIAEMGDKTQFTTVALSAKFGNPVAVLVGTTTGMLIADGLGILFGVLMNKKIPEKLLKWISAGIFAIFGVIGYIESAKSLMSLGWMIASLAAVAIVSLLIIVLIFKTGRNEGVFQEIAAMKDNRE